MISLISWHQVDAPITVVIQTVNLISVVISASHCRIKVCQTPAALGRLEHKDCWVGGKPEVHHVSGNLNYRDGEADGRRGSCWVKSFICFTQILLECLLYYDYCNFYCAYMHVYMHRCHSICVEVRGQLPGLTVVMFSYICRLVLEVLKGRDQRFFILMAQVLGMEQGS